MSLAWNWNPLMAVALLLPTWAYAHGVMHLWRAGNAGRGVTRWQVSAFIAGIIILFIALISPVDPLGEELLSMHMIQHVLLMSLAPPLLVIGAPPSVFLWVLPLSQRRTLTGWWMRQVRLRSLWRAVSAPFSAWVLHAAAIWLWHLPGAYQAALTDSLVHGLEHASFFGTALLFWNATLAQGQARRLLGVLLLFTTALHSSILGALMTFSEQVWYPLYLERAPVWGTTALADQQLAGLIMWIPAGVVYVSAILALLGMALHVMEHSEQRQRSSNE